MDPDTDFADTDTSETECQADNVPNAEQGPVHDACGRCGRPQAVSPAHL